MERIDLLAKYYEGGSNKFTRYWMYFRMANGAVNEFKSYFYVLTGIYVATPYLQSHILLATVVLGVLVTISVPLMIVFGHWLLHKASPATEYASTVKGTVYGFDGVEAAIRTAKNTDKIVELIQK